MGCVNSISKEATTANREGTSAKGHSPAVTRANAATGDAAAKENDSFSSLQQIAVIPSSPHDEERAQPTAEKLGGGIKESLNDGTNSSNHSGSGAERDVDPSGNSADNSSSSPDHQKSSGSEGGGSGSDGPQSRDGKQHLPNHQSSSSDEGRGGSNSANSQENKKSSSDESSSAATAALVVDTSKNPLGPKRTTHQHQPMSAAAQQLCQTQHEQPKASATSNNQSMSMKIPPAATPSSAHHPRPHSRAHPPPAIHAASLKYGVNDAEEAFVPQQEEVPQPASAPEQLVSTLPKETVVSEKDEAAVEQPCSDAEHVVVNLAPSNTASSTDGSSEREEETVVDLLARDHDPLAIPTPPVPVVDSPTGKQYEEGQSCPTAELTQIVKPVSPGIDHSAVLVQGGIVSGAENARVKEGTMGLVATTADAKTNSSLSSIQSMWFQMSSETEENLIRMNNHIEALLAYEHSAQATADFIAAGGNEASGVTPLPSLGPSLAEMHVTAFAPDEGVLHVAAVECPDIELLLTFSSQHQREAWFIEGRHVDSALPHKNRRIVRKWFDELGVTEELPESNIRNSSSGGGVVTTNGSSENSGQSGGMTSSDGISSDPSKYSHDDPSPAPLKEGNSEKCELTATSTTAPAAKSRGVRGDIPVVKKPQERQPVTAKTLYLNDKLLRQLENRTTRRKKSRKMIRRHHHPSGLVQNRFSSGQNSSCEESGTATALSSSCCGSDATTNSTTAPAVALPASSTTGRCSYNQHRQQQRRIVVGLPGVAEASSGSDPGGSTAALEVERLHSEKVRKQELHQGSAL